MHLWTSKMCLSNNCILLITKDEYGRGSFSSICIKNVYYQQISNYSTTNIFKLKSLITIQKTVPKKKDYCRYILRRNLEI